MHRQQILEILELDEKSKCFTHADPFRHLISGQLKGWHQSYFDDGWVILNASGTSWAVFEHFGSAGAQNGRKTTLEPSRCREKRCGLKVEYRMGDEHFARWRWTGLRLG